jgi:hypothetical protein
MDKEWTKLHRLNLEYRKGVESFLDFAFSKGYAQVFYKAMMFGFTTESKYHWHIWKLMKACKIKRTDVMTLMAYFTMGSSYEDARNKRMEEN